MDPFQRRVSLLLSLGGLLSVLLLAGCGSAPATSLRAISASTPQISPVQRWAGFPINASPRPLVIVGSTVNGPDAFLTDAAKLAFIHGQIDLRTQLPTGPTNANGYPLISAAAALAMLQPSGPESSVSPELATRLDVTAVKLGTSVFSTDRGDRTLPAWQFSFAGVEGVVSVLAISPAATWSPSNAASPTAGPPLVGRATVGADQRTLTVGFIGARAGTAPCTASYDVSVTESTTAVVVSVIAHQHYAPNVACTQVGYWVTATAQLSAPLGPRVVLNAAGQPVVVTSEG